VVPLLGTTDVSQTRSKPLATLSALVGVAVLGHCTQHLQCLAEYREGGLVV
jgi:hypothetical protein